MLLLFSGRLGNWETYVFVLLVEFLELQVCFFLVLYVNQWPTLVQVLLITACPEVQVLVS